MAFKGVIQFIKMGTARPEQIVSDIQFKVQDAFQRLVSGYPQVDGVFVKHMDGTGKGVVPLTNGPNRDLVPLKLKANVATVIQHKLGRPAKGWYVTDQASKAEVFRVPEAVRKNEFPDTQIILQSDEDVAIEFFIF